jgi:hypothetical protein
VIRELSEEAFEEGYIDAISRAARESGVDHAVAIVWIADKVELFRNTLGNLVYYEIGEGARTSTAAR